MSTLHKSNLLEGIVCEKTGANAMNQREIGRLTGYEAAQVRHDGDEADL